VKMVFAVIGDPIDHSFSPKLHSISFQEQGLDCTYVPIRVLQHELGQALKEFRKDLAGFNVTIPHKQSIIPYLDALDSTAQRFGAVNTVKNEGGKLVGYNTDGIGFMQGLQEVADLNTIRKTLLIGAGGAAQVVALELAPYSSITIANRSRLRAHVLAEKVKVLYPGSTVRTVGLGSVLQEKYDLVVNATPIGMGEQKDQIPVSSLILRNVRIVYDLVYNPQETRLLALASSVGCKTLNGLSMLIYQGLKSEEIWLGRPISKALKERIMERVRKELTKHG